MLLVSLTLFMKFPILKCNSVLKLRVTKTENDSQQYECVWKLLLKNRIFVYFVEQMLTEGEDKGRCFDKL